MGIFAEAASFDRVGMAMLRTGLVLVLGWIGALKFARYEADSIVPMVANSPLMKFFYGPKRSQYRQYMNKEGELIQEHRDWQTSNGTYRFSRILGLAIICIGLLIALYPIWPQVSALGSFLLVFMSVTTLSFLVTTPEAWVPRLGDSSHGFPYLSGVGRLIVKDLIMLGAAVVTMADAAKATMLR
jgi:reactive chlorine resistance protein C